MPLTVAARNSLLASLVGKTPGFEISHLSLHTGNPGTSGTNEVSGGSPAYARIAVDDTDFDAPASGEVLLSADKEFNGPASGNATHYGTWDGATFGGGGAIVGDTVFNSEGKFILKAGTKISLT